MSPRPRTVSNDQIFAATGRAMTRLGPARLTLADVGDEVGLTAAALVQRFGSKRGLLLAFVSSAPGMADACFARARAAHASPLDALVAAALEGAAHVASPDELANSLAFLQMDLSDPAFRKPALANSKEILAGYAALIRDAIGAGELKPCDPPRLARALHALVGGSLINWAIHRDGSLTTSVRRDLETLLEPLSVSSLRSSPKRRARSSDDDGAPRRRGPRRPSRRA
jgi:AcrR family transcriptional regulator